MKPGPSCSICAHPKRADIDAARGATERIAKRYGVSKSGLDRHRKHATNVVGKSDTPSVPPPPTTEEEALLDALAKAKAAMAKCETEDMPRLLNAITGISKRLALLGEARVVSEEDIVRSPTWRSLLTRLETALRPYPEAARAMARALTEAA